MPNEETTVIVVNYNSSRLVERLVSRTAPLPVIVVNNDSAESGALGEIAKRAPSRVTVVEAGANLGFGRGMNLGLKHCMTPTAALLNPDVEIRAQEIDALVAAARANKAAVVSPRLIDADGAVARTAFARHLSRRSLLVDVACSRFGGTKLEVVLRELAGANRSFGPAGPVAALNGALWIVNVATIKKVGGFDERFFLYGEESELCERLQRAGEVLWFEPTVQAVHTGGASTGGRRQTRQRLESTILHFDIRGHHGTARALGVLSRRFGRMWGAQDGG